jgi:hypothetical protein
MKILNGYATRTVRFHTTYFHAINFYSDHSYNNKYISGTKCLIFLTLHTSDRTVLKTQPSPTNVHFFQNFCLSLSLSLSHTHTHTHTHTHSNSLSVCLSQYMNQVLRYFSAPFKLSNFTSAFVRFWNFVSTLTVRGNLKVHHCVYKRLSVVHIMSHMNPIHSLILISLRSILILSTIYV